MALYAAGDEWPLLQAYVRYLRRCYVPVRDRVTFHAAFPADRMPAPAAAPEQVNRHAPLPAGPAAGPTAPPRPPITRDCCTPCCR